MYKPKKNLLTAGPSISQREIDYVTDAVKNGWNFHYRDYVEKFEKAFAKYIGVKHALALSSGTGALHGAMLGMGIGPGDEVIVPEISFVASANVVKYVGATPLFVDVEKDSWCIDPREIEKLITKKTKAIMPVHIYGNVSDMDPIRKIAKKYKLFLVEDACPSLGATYNGLKAGNLGDVAAFSFQGAKIAVTGEGGMLVTNNEEIYKKAKYYTDGAKDANKMFWHTDIGYMYRMANLLAALGLAQLERNEEFVKKKRRIFSWYKERLGKIEGISLNSERKGTKNIYWMTSIVLDRDFGITRDEVREKLKEKMVDTRPFFYPISMFPMFKHYRTPVAHHLGLNGINLPSGLNLTEEEIDYISTQVIDILKKRHKK